MRALTFFIALALTAVFSNKVNAEEADSSKIEKVIVKTITVSKDGKVTTKTTVNGKEVDGEKTPIPGMGQFHMDIFGGDEDFPPMDDMDWAGKDFGFSIEGQDDSTKVFVMRTPHGTEKFEMKCPMMMQMEKDFPFGQDSDNPSGPDMPQVPDHRVVKPHTGNVIDLNDPNIVSFQRETTKDGNEKITIVRKKQEDKEQK
jgi:hypothetical protein